MNIQDKIYNLQNKIQEIKYIIAIEKCDYKYQYNRLSELESQLATYLEKLTLTHDQDDSIK